MWTHTSPDELYHYGVKGMKWGVHRNRKQTGGSYQSTSIRSAIARRNNAKVDKNFKKWQENAQRRDNAIAIGKQRNEALIKYDTNKSDKSAKASFKTVNKEYKKALSQNTTYRKGVVRQDVGRDLSRKYLSEAKKVKKQLDANPGNKQLKRRYNELMSKHDVERERARRAVEVSTNRMNKIRTIKSAATKTVKAATTTAAVGVGLAAVNKYVMKGNLNVTSDSVLAYTKRIKKLMGYIY